MASFWDKLKSRRNKRKDDNDREDRDENRDIAIFLEEQRLANLEAQRKQQEDARKQEEARKAEREKQALAEQKRQEEARKKASQEREVINPYEPKDVVKNAIRNTPIDTSPVRMNASVNSKKALQRNVLDEKEKETDDNVVEYVNPETGKVVLLKPGQMPPSGYVQRSRVSPVFGGSNGKFNNSALAVARAKANADRLIYGKRALAPSNKTNNFFTTEFARSAKEQNINIEQPSINSGLTLPSVPAINTQKSTNDVLSTLKLNVSSEETIQRLSAPVDSSSISADIEKTSKSADTKTTDIKDLTGSVDTQKVLDESLNNSSTEKKTALAPSTKGIQWQQAAGTGQLADSAARVELSTKVDITNMTEEDKAIYAKEQAWKNMSEEQKILARQTLPDKDGDLVPDIYDCVPDDYTKQGYADIYLGGKYALGPSKKAQRTIVSGKGRLKMAQSMKGPSVQKGAVAPEAMVGQILDLSAGGSSAGNNPALSGEDLVTNVLGKSKRKNIANKLNANSPLTKSVTVKSKSNDFYKVNMNKNFNNKYSVEALNRKKFDSKVAKKSGLDKMSANKAFKDVSKRFGL